MAYSTEKAQRRAARYSELVRMGFTSTEASRLRDWSGVRIDAYVIARKAELEAEKPEELSDKQQRQLEAIYQTHDRDALTFQARVRSKRERSEDFSRWSNRYNGFPPEYEAVIIAYNKEAGKDEYDSFGFRIFYWQYVEGMNEMDAREQADERDS